MFMRSCLVAAALIAAIVPASAQDFPNRTIHIVVAYAPGGTGDIVARLIAVPLQAELGHQVVVDNKPGACGTIGAAFVARANADGYTILLGSDQVVATGALQSISKEYYEAASIDGASGPQQFFRITLPLLRPAMIPAAMYGLIVTFNLFNLIYMVSGGGPLRQTEILVTTAFRLVNEQRLYGLAAAFGIYTMIILLVLTLLTNRITKATESYV